MARPRKGNVALNLSVDEDLKRLFDAQCALEGVEMSEVTEQLYREYLKTNKAVLRIAEEDESHGLARPQKRSDKPVRYSKSKRRTKKDGK